MFVRKKPACFFKYHIRGLVTVMGMDEALFINDLEIDIVYVVIPLNIYRLYTGAIQT